MGSDNGLSPDERQAIIWTNAVLLSTGPFRTTFSEIVFETRTLPFKKMLYPNSMETTTVNLYSQEPHLEPDTT